MKIMFEKLTDDEQDEFVEGFKSADDIGVDDWDCSTPWGAPWFWADSMGSQASGEDVKKFLDWGEENCLDVVELAKHGEENEFYGALEKCFGKGAE